MSKLRTPLCDLLGIELPILQSGMGRIAGPDLVAAVSAAGGLGILAGLFQPPDELRRAIREVRARTDRPFGVNQWLHPALLPPPDPATIEGPLLEAVQRALDAFRAPLGLPPSRARPESLPDLVAAGFEVILEERVPVWSIGLGNPTAEQTRRCRERGVRVMAMVTSVADARAVAERGVDVIVAQGGEAGGHRSAWAAGGGATVGTLALTPQVVDAVNVPVVAAGGISDGRGLVAALALGAAGVLLGTRFVATREATVTAAYRDALLSRSGEDTVITDVITGLPARVLRNELTDGYHAAEVLPPLLQRGAGADIHTRAAAANDARFIPLFAGQGVGLVRDLPGAAEVVRALAAEAEAVLARL